MLNNALGPRIMTAMGKGRPAPGSCSMFTKAELDGCHMVNREYSKKEYKTLTPLQKMKLWILRNPGKTPGEGGTDPLLPLH